MKADDLLTPSNRIEAALLEKLNLKHLPEHIAVIMDATADGRSLVTSRAWQGIAPE